MIEDSTFYNNQGLRVRLCREEDSGRPVVPMAPPRLMFRVFRLSVGIPRVHAPPALEREPQPEALCRLEGPDPYHVTRHHPKP